MVRVIVMAGGEGRRMGNPEKPLLVVCGEPMLSRVLRAVEYLGEVYVATTERHVGVVSWCRRRGVNVILTRGGGYPNDLRYTMEVVGAPALIVPGDLPLITRGILISFIQVSQYLKIPLITLTVVRDGVGEFTGISYVRMIPAGDPLPWIDLALPWSSHFINVNTRDDLELANEECRRVNEED
jgi:adenosylcobinamide-phosphate guanylyltransferase